jgi:hypothetical protein
MGSRTPQHALCRERRYEPRSTVRRIGQGRRHVPARESNLLYPLEVPRRINVSAAARLSGVGICRPYRPRLAMRNSRSQMCSVIRRMRGSLESLPISAFATHCTVGSVFSVLAVSATSRPPQIPRAQFRIAAGSDRSTKPPVADSRTTSVSPSPFSTVDRAEDPHPATNHTIAMIVTETLSMFVSLPKYACA